jgi:hypothetical protein
MGLHLPLILSLFLAPAMQVIKNPANEIIIHIDSARSDLEQCVKEGYEVHYEFTMQACLEKKGWFDNCLDRRVERSVLKYDSVSDTYQLLRDRIGDRVPAETKSVVTAEEAWKLAETTNPLQLSYITHNKKDFSKKENFILKTRVVGSCEENKSRTLSWIASVFTLGFAQSADVDTGWYTFRAS